MDFITELPTCEDFDGIFVVVDKNHLHPVFVDGEKEYKIEKILDSKVSQNRLKFLVRWKGYTVESDEWIDKDYLENSQGLISEFNKRQKCKWKS